MENTDGCKIPCLAVEFEAWNWVRAAATGKFLQNNVFLKTAHQLRDHFLEIFIERKAKQTINTQKINTKGFFSFFKARVPVI